MVKIAKIPAFICDRCKFSTWEIYDEDSEKVSLFTEAFGKEAIICHKCGAVRYPNEVF